jgi:hypothetical protein
MIAAPPAGVSAVAKPKPAPLTFVPPATELPAPAAAPQGRAVRPKIEFVPPASEAPAPPRVHSPAAPELVRKPEQAPLIMSLAAISTAGRTQSALRSPSMANANVSLPAVEVSAGLAKGKVAFSWGQIRSWITPAPDGETEVRTTTELTLPLKVVAPSFLRSSKSRWLVSAFPSMRRFQRFSMERRLLL